MRVTTTPAGEQVIVHLKNRRWLDILHLNSLSRMISAMDPEQSAEFDQVRSAIVEGMRNGSYLPDAGLRVAQLLVLPSFQDSICWELRSIARPKAASESRLYQVRWSFGADCEAFRSPVERVRHPRPFKPSIATRSGVVAMSDFGSVIDTLSSAAIPLMPKSPPSGADGTSYELAIGDYFCNSRIAWWVELPAEWKGLESQLAEFLTLCESADLRDHPTS